MKKFAPLVITAAAMAFAGCSAETGTPSAMQTAQDTQATCANPEGTNAAIAALTEAITHELHRWQITTDFYVGTGTNNQQVLKLTSAGLQACGGSCPETQNMLSFQDSTMDQTLIMDGTRVSSWSYASRVVTGFGNQVSCQRNNQCPFPAHVFGFRNGAWVQPTVAAGACDTLFTHVVSAPGGAALTATQVGQLKNALVWTTGNGPNPYIAYQSTASTVSIDPSGGVNTPSTPPGGVYGCNPFDNTMNLTGLACTCDTTGITGVLKQTKPVAQPNQYYCVAHL